LLAIGDREARELFALHELLDQNLAASVAEDPIAQHRVNRALGLGRALRDDHSFPGSQSRRLDHHRRREFRQGGLRVAGVAVLRRAGSGNTGFHHQVLGKPLRGLDARRLSRRPEDWQPTRLEEIDDSRFERKLRSDDSQIDELVLGEVGQLFLLLDRNRNAARDRRDARIAGRSDQLEAWIVAAQFPGERVLASAAANDQYFHAKACSRSAIRSPTSSTPQESRSRSSLRPRAARRSGGTEACVIDAGWLIRLSTPPRDSAREKTRTLPSTLAAFSLLPVRTEIIPPKPFI